MNRCLGLGAAVHVGLAWQQIKSGEWERWLIRQCQSCNEHEVERLQRVDTEYETCFVCLSQEAKVETDGEEAYLRCMKCQHHIRYVEEVPIRPPEPDKDDDEWISHDP